MHQLGLHLRLTESTAVSFDHVDHTNMYDHTRFEEFIGFSVEEKIIIHEALKKIVMCVEKS